MMRNTVTPDQEGAYTDPTEAETPLTGGLPRLDRLSGAQLQALMREIQEKAAHVKTAEEAREFSSKIAQITRQVRIQRGMGIAPSPLAQAKELNPDYVERPHLAYLSSRITQAVRDVERGKDRKLMVSMPPRAGKSTMTSQFAPLWFLRRHPEWKIMMGSHSSALTYEWAGNIRRMIEDKPTLGIALKKDAGARARWETVEGGGMYATGIGGSVMGRGARVFIIDDPISDFTDAHSPRIRQAMWNWWLSVAQTRLEPPSLVLVTMTRWHEDDFVGRLLSQEYEGDPREWENIMLPALSTGHDDALRRPADVPLLSPLLPNETENEARQRWEGVKTAVGSYTFSSMYQQRPAPAKGAVFDVGWWRYWTTDPGKATDDGRIVYVDPGELSAGRWLDSWDCTFKGGEGASSYVVAQRWVRSQANRYLIAQKRGRWTFTETIKQMKVWARNDDYAASPYGDLVHERLVEEKANGAAIIDTLKDQISGMKPVNPGASKEARARAITPEVESGNVYLPHPTDPGNEWVQDLLSELRNFPHDMYDDQVDALTQALMILRGAGNGQVTVPGASARRSNRPGPSLNGQPQGSGYRQINRSYGSAARTMNNRRIPGR